MHNKCENLQPWQPTRSSTRSSKSYEFLESLSLYWYPKGWDKNSPFLGAKYCILMSLLARFSFMDVLFASRWIYNVFFHIDPDLTFIFGTFEIPHVRLVIF